MLGTDRSYEHRLSTALKYDTLVTARSYDMEDENVGWSYKKNIEKHVLPFMNNCNRTLKNIDG